MGFGAENGGVLKEEEGNLGPVFMVRCNWFLELH